MQRYKQMQVQQLKWQVLKLYNVCIFSTISRYKNLCHLNFKEDEHIEDSKTYFLKYEATSNAMLANRA